MSIDKFRFVSPGVYVNEIDNSQLPRAPEEMGPVVIGRALRGPVMRPVKVQSFSDFVEVFGEPVPGGSGGGDVWRKGNKTAPTYAAYAAQAYLKNSGALTFVRLAGYQNPQESGGKAGWSTNNAYGLFVVPVVSGSDGYKTNGTGSAVLTSIIYAGDGTYGLKGKGLKGEDIATSLNKWVISEGSYLQYNLVVNGKTNLINFDESDKKYIRSVLNTNPILTNGNITSPAEDYFLGETFKTFINSNLSSLKDGVFAASLVKLKHADFEFSNFNEAAQDAQTGWIVSQHKGPTGSFTAVDGEYDVKKLFKIVGLTEGEWNSQNLKVSIEDIKAPPNELVKYGTFSLSLRKIDDSDLTPQYVERFTGLSLDPFSENYIAKKIGDKYTEWDYEKKEFIEYNTYNNKSKFIRVEMNPEVDGGLSDADLLPFGFYGPTLLTASAVSGTEVQVSFIDQVVSGANNITASFLLPKLPLLSTTTDSPVSSFNSVYFGFKTNAGNTKRYNEDIVDLVRSQPVGYKGTNSFLFSLNDLSGSVSGSVLEKSKAVSWKEGNRASGSALSQDLVLQNFNRFTVPLVGGSDGVDITEKDPFNRRVLKSKTEYTNYAYNSIKVAIESISDPEVVEMNLACIPGVDNEGLTSLLIDKCEQRGDALAIIDLDGDYVPEEGKADTNVKASARKPNVDTAISNMKSRAMNSSYGCAFFPWVLGRDILNNNTVWLPSSVAALGTFSSSQKRTELWFAPAGFNRGGLSDGAAGIPVVQTALRLTSKNRDDLYAVNINPIATFPSEGIVVFGQKTLQVTPSALDRINVRRLMIYVKKEISRMARTVLFDPNVDITWGRFTNQANPFLQSVQARFGLSEFRVVLDSTTTTPDLVDRNVVYAKILLKPTRAIEFIALDFVITNSGASFAD